MEMIDKNINSPSFKKIGYQESLFANREKNSTEEAIADKIQTEANRNSSFPKSFSKTAVDLDNERINKTSENTLASFANSIENNDALQIEDTDINKSTPIHDNKLTKKSEVIEYPVKSLNLSTTNFKETAISTATYNSEMSAIRSENCESQVTIVNSANCESEASSMWSEDCELGGTTINSGSETKEGNKHILKLSHDTLKNFPEISENLIELLKTEAILQVNNEYGFGYYDFCLIASDDDYDDADDFKCSLMSQFNLKGCMLEDDNITLGRDVFESYEFMMNRSTKVMFYLTENFNEERFCRRLQNGAVFKTLVSRIHAEKCVPLFPKGLCDIPLALSGILGIDLRRKKQLKKRIHSTFSEEVRAFRVKREKHLEDVKQEYSKKLLIQKIEGHIQKDQKTADINNTCDTQKPQNSSERCATSSNGNASFSNLKNVLHSVDVDREGVDRVVQSILDAVSKERNVTITNSSNVRIGNQIDVTVVVGASNMQESYSSSSDDSEYTDSEESCSDNDKCDFKDL